MIGAVGLTAALALLPLHGAETVPPGHTWMHLGGGIGFLNLGLPSLPVVPVLEGEAELAHGVGSAVDMRLSYRTHLGLIHRLGAELRTRLLHGERWALAARLMPSAQLGGALQGGIDYSGDISTQAALLFTLRRPRLALTADVGATVQWSAFQSLGGQRRIDVSAFPAYVDLAVAAEWRRGSGPTLSARLEVSVSLIPDDPFAVFGTYPRLVIGSNFGL